MKSKSQVRYTKELADFICDKISQGMTVEEMVRKYPKKLPTPRAIYGWRKDKPEFREKTNAAYESFFMVKIEEMETLTSTPLEILYPKITDFRVAAEARRIRLDYLKFLTAKLAGILTPSFRIKQELEVSAPTQYNVINYAPKKIEEKKDE